MSEEKDTLSLHPIQLEHVRLYEIDFHSVLRPGAVEEEKEVEWNISIASGEFEPESGIIVVALKAFVEKEKTKKLFYTASIEIHGHFEVDTSEFDIEELPKWVKGNAFYILFPYIREHIYGIILRAGYLPPILPLLEIPLEKAIVGKSLKASLSPKP